MEMELNKEFDQETKVNLVQKFWDKNQKERNFKCYFNIKRNKSDEQDKYTLFCLFCFVSFKTGWENVKKPHSSSVGGGKAPMCCLQWPKTHTKNKKKMFSRDQTTVEFENGR